MIFQGLQIFSRQILVYRRRLWINGLAFLQSIVVKIHSGAWILSLSSIRIGLGPRQNKSGQRNQHSQNYQ